MIKHLPTAYPTMYALKLQDEKRFLRLEGGFCDLTTPHEIRWFPHYLPATEQAQKLAPVNLVAIESRDLLLLMVETINHLSPEILALVKELETRPLSDEELFSHIEVVNRLAAMRGGMEEMRQKRKEDQEYIKELEHQAKIQKLELEKLMVSVADYQKVLQNFTK